MENNGDDSDYMDDASSESSDDEHGRDMVVRARKRYKLKVYCKQKG